MLKLHEQTIPKKDATPAVMVIKAGRILKKNKNKKPQIAAQGKNLGGHLRRNCLVYLAELMKKNKQASNASTSSIFTTKLYSFPNKCWVYDTGCGTHICNTTQRLKGNKKLKPRALNMYVGNGHSAAVEAIESFNSSLLNTLVIVLDKCYYAPSLLGFSIYAISNKRAKLKFDYTLLWHCRFRHLNKQRIEKLQHDGILKSIEDEFFDKFVSCMFVDLMKAGNTVVIRNAKIDMFKGSIRLAVDKWGRIKLTEPTSYIVKEDNNLSLVEVFQREVQNQLEKTIKALCSDRGEKCMSQEFLDHLKEHGIIFQRTPSYTSQHNAASSNPKSGKWLESMNVEMKSMKDNQVCDLFYLLFNAKIVGIKWLFKEKTDMDGNVHTYKARLVTKGFTQTYRVDFEETFSHIADIRAIRILIAITAYYDYEIWQMDIKTAFLSGHLNEEVYMALRKWNKTFDEEI
nr:putative retrotransposon Ty1-copia subclass protein [Tanacetum cinerariifolium]